MVDHPVVHVQLARLGQLLQRGGGERLGIGGDRKQRARIDLIRLADLAQAEALLHHHLAILDDRHRDAGHVEGLARAVDVGAEILQLRRQHRPHGVVYRYWRRRRLRNGCLRPGAGGNDEQGTTTRQVRGKESQGHRRLRWWQFPDYRGKPGARPALEVMGRGSLAQTQPPVGFGNGTRHR